MTAFTDINMVNTALINVAVSPITAFSDTVTQAVAAKQIYEPKVQELLSLSVWHFATSQVKLNQASVPPLARASEAWQLPSDILVIRAVTSGGDPVVFDRYEDKVVTSIGSGSVVYLDYTKRVLEGAFPPYFQAVLVGALSSAFAAAVCQNPSLANFWNVYTYGPPQENGLGGAMGRALRADHQGRTSKGLSHNRFRAVRQ